MHSSLTNKIILSPNHSGQRTSKVTKVTIHHMAGNLTIEQCGAIFQNTARQASSNYGIGSDGRVGCYVDENCRAWTSSSNWNDQQGITIEVADNNLSTWSISDAAYSKLIELCADICKRYGITPSYDGTQNATFTEHRMFAATTCPGPWIHARMPQIVKDVKDVMAGSKPTTNTVQGNTPDQILTVGSKVRSIGMLVEKVDVANQMVYNSVERHFISRKTSLSQSQ
jgi:N-acetylmuramoyl-L-alanine amidase